ncbi:Aprataxin [Grifola frondosa]|uniref:Aprataxin n=1 Tax=Grifola frondosa TaxID=5627 RepID=A0A1C7MLR1_GRIFR|nr:Aprataxin [Grifola frondosa]
MYHAATTITIFDAFPKSIFHFLVSELMNLRTLLKCDKARILEVLDNLRAEGRSMKSQIEEEMLKRYGFKWGVWMGFHSVQSMECAFLPLTSEYIHLHVLSADLCSPAMKVKKHFNSFRPGLGFFLPIDDVISWFDDDVDPSYRDMMIALKPSRYEPYLKEDMQCWRCNEVFKTMPKLKEHLQQEWDKEASSEKAKMERKLKRKHVEGDPASNEDKVEETLPAKKRATDPSGVEPDSKQQLTEPDTKPPSSEADKSSPYDIL